MTKTPNTPVFLTVPAVAARLDMKITTVRRHARVHGSLYGVPFAKSGNRYRMLASALESRLEALGKTVA